MEAVFENNCANALIVYGMFIVCSYLSGSIGIVRKNVTKDAVMVCICIITHTIFFIIIAPVSHYRGTPRFWAFFGALFLCGEGWWKGRTDCRRGGCMVVPGAVVSPGHTKRLSLLPCRAPHNSPCTLMRTWLRQMGLTLRLVAAEYLPGRSLRRQV